MNVSVSLYLYYVFSYELRSPENSSLSTHESSDKFIVYNYYFN